MAKNTDGEAPKNNLSDEANIVFRISKEDRAELVEAARRDHRDLSSLMRKITSEFLEREKVSSGK